MGDEPKEIMLAVLWSNSQIVHIAVRLFARISKVTIFSSIFDESL